MTSFIIESQVDHPTPPAWEDPDDCSFCRIILRELPAFIIFEDDQVIAILDILPLRKGHTLVIPKIHCPRLSELPSDYAAAAGKMISQVARALTEALQNTALNVVCNQEYAQAVPHVHYHIIPAPDLKSLPSAADADPKVSKTPVAHSRKEMHQKEFETRDELDEDEAGNLARIIRAHL